MSLWYGRGCFEPALDKRRHLRVEYACVTPRGFGVLCVAVCSLYIGEQEFLKGCRDLCTKYGALLVFDEVMTGFRIAYGGAQVHLLHMFVAYVSDVCSLSLVIPPCLEIWTVGRWLYIAQGYCITNKTRPTT